MTSSMVDWVQGDDARKALVAATFGELALTAMSNLAQNPGPFPHQEIRRDMAVAYLGYCAGNMGESGRTGLSYVRALMDVIELVPVEYEEAVAELNQLMVNARARTPGVAVNGR